MTKRLQTTSVAVLLATMIGFRSMIVGAQEPAPLIERNVVYGMFSGLALLLDVYQPAKMNGIGIVAIIGTGWHRSTVTKFDAIVGLSEVLWRAVPG